MPKKARSNLILSVVALAVSVIIMAGVIFAWIVTNEKVDSGGIDLDIMNDESGVYLEKFNDSDVPDDGYRMYPEDTVKLGLRTTKDLKALIIKLTTPGMDASSFISKFAPREDLLNGNYQSAVSVIDSDGQKTIEYDFDIDTFLKYEKNISDPLLRQLYKMAFLYEFTENNSLLDTMTVKFTGIGMGSDAEDYSEKPLELIMSGNKTEMAYSFFGTNVPIGHPIRSSRYFTVEDNKISGMSFPYDLPLTVVVEYGHGHNGDPPSVPKMTLTSDKDYALKSALETKYPEYSGSLNKIFDNKEYYALNYNCFNFFQMTIGFSGN